MLSQIDGAIHYIENEKLFNIYEETVQLKNKYKELSGWGLSEEYNSMANLGLLIANFDNYLSSKNKGFVHAIKKFNEFNESFDYSILIIRAKIGDITRQIEIKKSHWLSTYAVNQLKEERNRYQEILSMFNKVKSVVERL